MRGTKRISNGTLCLVHRIGRSITINWYSRSCTEKSDKDEEIIMLISIPKKFWVNPYGLTKEEAEKRKEELRRLSNKNIRVIKNNPKGDKKIM
ncbi:MAG: hypothetical protein LC101_08515 [Flavobacteriales bacterium]|nr:hypothetical protein [Flavobacteriales bacterium]